VTTVRTSEGGDYCGASALSIAVGFFFGVTLAGRNFDGVHLTSF
jgi:hypothetical protein